MATAVKRVIRTQFDRIRNYSCAGNKLEPTYKLKVNEDGIVDLKQVGTTDCYSYIQSHADTVNLKYILERYTKGDTSVLDKVAGVYGDFTNVPTTLAELSQRVIDAEHLFNSLPLEARREFDFNPAKFYTAIGTEKYDHVISKIKNDTVIDSDVNVKIDIPTIEKEVVVNE